MARPTIYLLDAYALIFRAYYAFLRNPRINSKGLNTSAMFGFVNAMEEVLRNRKPSHMAVCFDHKSPNVRVQQFPYYKANRQETPEKPPPHGRRRRTFSVQMLTGGFGENVTG